MTDTEKTTPRKAVTWRLPTRIASDNAGDWTPLREHLSAWAESGDRLDVENDETKVYSLSMPDHVTRALEKKAKRLTREHGKRYTPGLVARLIWDTWENE